MNSFVINQFLSSIRHPSRYIGKELNSIEKETNTLFSGVLCGAGSYEKHMDMNAYLRFYTLLNKNSQAYWQRAFMPEHDAKKSLAALNLSVFALETFKPVVDFQIVLIYISDILEYLNLAHLFTSIRFPMNSSSRGSEFPPVVAVGPGIENPLPLLSVFDFILWGEPEYYLSLFEKFNSENLTKPDIISLLNGAVGVLTEEQFEKNSSPNIYRIVSIPALNYYPAKLPLPHNTQTMNPYEIELSRGTFSGLRHLTREFRDRPLLNRRIEDILVEMKNAIRYGGETVFKLKAKHLEEYEEFPQLIRRLKALSQEQNIKFLIDGLVFDPTSERSDFLRSLTKTRFIIPLITVHERLKKSLNYSVPTSVLKGMFDKLITLGWENFLIDITIGFPGEIESSLSLISDWLNGLHEFSVKSTKFNYRIRISCFVPAIFSPLQFAGFISEPEYNSRVEYLEKMVKLPNCTWEIEDYADAARKTFLMRIDKDDGKLLQLQIESDENWLQKAIDHDKEKYLNYFREKSMYDKMNYQFFNIPVSAQFLKDEKIKAIDSLFTYSCQTFRCYQCGLQREVYSETVDCFKKASEHPVPQKYQYVLNRFDDSSSNVLSYGRQTRRTDSKQPQIIKRMRIKFAKSGYGRFLSQREILNIFEKAARISGFPLAYSQGQMPKPKISLGLSLAGGYSSKCEYFDAEILVMREAEMLGKINRFMPDGIVILEARSIFRKVPSLISSISEVVYDVKQGTSVIDFSFSEFATAFENNWRNNNSIPVRNRAGEVELVEAENWINGVKKSDNNLELSLRVSEGRTIDPKDIIRSVNLEKEIENDLSITRIRQLCHTDNDEILNPMELLNK